MSYGQQLLSQYLQHLLPFEVHENARPDWLKGLEMDFWFPGLRLAVEFQGAQHYAPRDGDFHAFRRQRHNDRRKRQVLTARGILLIRVDAIHLGYGALLCRLRSVAKMHGVVLPVRDGREALRGCRDLDRAARAYRQILRDKHDDPTVRRRGKAPRRDAIRRRFADTVDGAVRPPQQ